jgi:hypothetical protein
MSNWRNETAADVGWGDWERDERKSALAVMSVGDKQAGCEHPRLNRYGECAVCGDWLTNDHR